MKSKVFIALTIVLCLGLCACAERGINHSKPNEITQTKPKSEDNSNDPENKPNSELKKRPLKEKENDNVTSNEEKTTKSVDVSCSVQKSMIGTVDEKNIELSLNVPANWEQSDTGTTFYNEGESKTAEGFWATIVPEDQTIWSTAKVNLVPGYISSKIVNINGQEVLLSIDSVPWDKNEKEPPEDQKEYCYNYHIPYQDMYITIQFYTVGKDNEKEMQLHRKVLESIEFH